MPARGLAERDRLRACPRSAPGSNAIAPSAFSGTATIAAQRPPTARRRASGPRRRRRSCATAATGAPSRARRRRAAPPAIASSSALRAARRASRGRRCTASARGCSPTARASAAPRPRRRRRAARARATRARPHSTSCSSSERLELGEPLGDRDAVEAREPLDREQRVVRCGQRLARRRRRNGPSRAARSRRAARPCRAALVADVPRRDVRVVAEHDAEPGAGDLRPRVWLVPVHPARRRTRSGRRPSRRRPGPAAEAVARLEQQHGAAAQRRLARRGHAGEAAADDDHVGQVGGAHRRLPPSARVSAAAPRSAERATASDPRAAPPAPGCRGSRRAPGAAPDRGGDRVDVELALAETVA